METNPGHSKGEAVEARRRRRARCRVGAMVEVGQEGLRVRVTTRGLDTRILGCQNTRAQEVT